MFNERIDCPVSKKDKDSVILGVDMKILVLNSGSSSLKYRVYDMPGEKLLAKGLVERIGLDIGKITHCKGDDKFPVEQTIPDHKVAINAVLGLLTDPKQGVLKHIDEIAAFGHRVVHGGDKFSDSVLVTDNVKDAITEFADMAPLHNPPNLFGIEACEHILPNVPNIAVFDTAFHQTMPDYAYMYAIPYHFFEKYKVRRYGFHGTSHRFVALRAAELMGYPIERSEMVTCHLGNGSSICAIKYGKSVDTSLGFGTISGIPMGTRTGDIDPTIITYLQRKCSLSKEELEEIMYKHSGLLGVSGYSDMRDVVEHALKMESMSMLAMRIMAYSTRKYIGSYAAAMGNVDAIVFTAGIGENDSLLRSLVLDGLEFLGAEMDELKNQVTVGGKEGEISVDNSRVKVYVIPTNEELMIARDTVAVLTGAAKSARDTLRARGDD